MIVRFGSLASGQEKEDWLKTQQLETWVPYEYSGEVGALESWVDGIGRKLSEGAGNEAVVILGSESGKPLGEELTVGEITKAFDVLAASPVLFYVYFC